MAWACKHFGTLKKLHRCGRSQRAHLISRCGPEQIKAICECADNILRGAVPLTTKQKQRLYKHSNLLANFADPKIGWQRKRNFLKTQEGGAILTTILGIAIPALVSYLASKF
jgi:hypothetical protein